MSLKAGFMSLLVVFLTVTGAFGAEKGVRVKFAKENSPITTAYGYELGQGNKGDTFIVQETRGDLIFGYYPTTLGGIRGYVLQANLDQTDELKEFIKAEKARRDKLEVALEKKVELSKLPQPPGKTLTEYVEDKQEDFTTVSGVLLKSVTWTKDKSPYLITGPVYIPSGVILFVDPGVEVYCEKSESPGAGISSGQVNGIIVAGNVLIIGRPTKIITFRGFGSKAKDRSTWGGIHILESADPGSIFRWAIFENAATAISCGRGPVISNCIFQHNYSGLLLDEKADTANVLNNIFISNTTGLEVRGTPSMAEIYNNIFAFNEPNGGIRAWRGAEPRITYNNLYKNAQNYIGWSPFSTDILANPMFADIENGDYHLFSQSPLIGGGRGKSTVGLYAGRDAIHVPPEKVPDTEKKEDEGASKAGKGKSEK